MPEGTEVPITNYLRTMPSPEWNKVHNYEKKLILLQWLSISTLSLAIFIICIYHKFLWGFLSRDKLKPLIKSLHMWCWSCSLPVYNTYLSTGLNEENGTKIPKLPASEKPRQWGAVLLWAELCLPNSNSIYWSPKPQDLRVRLYLDIQSLKR